MAQRGVRLAEQISGPGQISRTVRSNVQGARSKDCAPFLCPERDRRPIEGHGAFDLTRRGLFAPALGLLAAACAPLGLRGGLDGRLSRDVRRVAQDLPYGEDPRQRIDLYAPHGARGLPVLVFLGEPGAREQSEPTALALAARGFVVALPDYPVTEPPLFPVQIADAAVATAETARIASNHGGDPSRLGVMGRGAGAGLAMMVTLDRRYMAAVDQPNLIRAAAGLAGVYGVGQTTDPTWTQPVAYVRPDAPPIWLGYGADGDTPAVVDAVTLDQRIRAVGGRSAVYVRSGSAPMSSVLEDAAKFFHSALR